MPRATSNGPAQLDEDEPLAAGDSGEALVWDTGLSQFLGRLEEDLIRWHSEERVKAKERQMKGLRAHKDLSSVEVTLRDAAAARRQQLLLPQAPVEAAEAVDELLALARRQQDEMQQLVELMRGHSRLHLEHVGGSALLQKLPPAKLDGEAGSGQASGDLAKHVKLFLELAEKARQAQHFAGEPPIPMSGGAKGAEKKRRTREERTGEKKSKKHRTKVHGGSRGLRGAPEAESGDWSESSYSDSPSPEVRGGGRRRERGAIEPRRHDRAGRHRRGRSYSPDSFEDDSLYSEYSCSGSSLSDRRDHQRAGARQNAERGGGHGRGAGRRRGAGRKGGDPSGAGAAGGRDPGDLSALPQEIDRFVRVNKLESRCEKILRDLSPVLARRVMGLGGGSNTFELSGDVRDPTAVVLARIRKAREGPGARRRADGGGKGGGRGGGGGGGGGAHGRGHPGRRHCSRSPSSASSRSRSMRPGGGGAGHRRGGMGAAGPPA